MTTLYVLVAVLVLVGLWLVMVYNGFVALVNRAKEAWSDIEVQMKRRYDLIPNLVNTVKGYATHEREAFHVVSTTKTS